MREERDPLFHLLAMTFSFVGLYAVMHYLLQPLSVIFCYVAALSHYLGQAKVPVFLMKFKKNPIIMIQKILLINKTYYKLKNLNFIINVNH